MAKLVAIPLIFYHFKKREIEYFKLFAGQASMSNCSHKSL